MRSIARKVLLVPVLAGALALVPLGASAGPLPAGCTKTQGTVTCSSFDGPGNNQGGVGTTTTTRTQGNTSNFSPAPQEPGTTSSCRPAKSQGNPCN